MAPVAPRAARQAMSHAAFGATAAPIGASPNSAAPRKRLQLELVGRHEFRSGAVAQRYRPTTPPTIQPAA